MISPMKNNTASMAATIAIYFTSEKDAPLLTIAKIINAEPTAIIIATEVPKLLLEYPMGPVFS